MSVEVKAAVRKFKFGSMELADPNPSLSADEVMDFYSLTHPEIASGKLVGPTLDEDNGTYEYEFKTSIQSKA